MAGLSERLRQVREHYGDSHRGIAGRFHLGASTWQKYEADGRLPEDAVLAALHADGFDLNWLVTGQGAMMLAGRGLSADSVRWVDQHHSYPGFCRIVEDDADSSRLDLVPEVMADALERALPHLEPSRFTGGDQRVRRAAASVLIGFYSLAFWDWWKRRAEEPVRPEP